MKGAFISTYLHAGIAWQLIATVTTAAWNSFACNYHVFGIKSYDLKIDFFVLFSIHTLILYQFV